MMVQRGKYRRRRSERDMRRGKLICNRKKPQVAVDVPLWYSPRMQHPEDRAEDGIHSEAFLHSLMRRQLRLSIGCAVAFLLMLLGLPVANYFFPQAMSTRVLGGFTLSWSLLGIGFFPAVWLISWFFIRRSIALEEEEVAEVQRRDTDETQGRPSNKGR